MKRPRPADAQRAVTGAPRSATGEEMPVDRAFKEFRLLPGYPEASLNLMASIAAAIERDEELPGDVRQWVVEAFRKIARGDDAALALELKVSGKKGLKPSITRLNALELIARCVYLHLQRGETLEGSKRSGGALEKAATDCKVSVGTARVAWEVWGDGIKDLHEKWRLGQPNLDPLRRPRKKAK